MSAATHAQYMQLLAEERKRSHGFHPLSLDVSVMSKLYPETKAEIRRIAESNNRNVNIGKLVTEFLQQTFPSGRTPSGTVVADPAGLKAVILDHFTLIC